MTEKEDLDIRSQIAKLLTRRCNNCYSLLPGYQVHGTGWYWFTPNFGPFCKDCWTEAVQSTSLVYSEGRTK